MYVLRNRLSIVAAHANNLSFHILCVARTMHLSESSLFFGNSEAGHLQKKTFDDS